MRRVDIQDPGRVVMPNDTHQGVFRWVLLSEPVNPGGTASYGVVILRNEGVIHEASEIFYPQKGHERETSNNVAEYSGFRHALIWLLGQNLNGHCIEIRGDSMLVIKQMFGSWRIKQGFYVPIAMECIQLLRQFPNIRGKWIPREENSLADKLSKAELLRAGVEFRIQKGE
jgi:ribonuclease HI